MITKTFITRCNTIVSNRKENFGLNPICMLNHGGMLSRVLLYFDESKIKALHEDGTYPDLKKFRHTIRMKNCGSVDQKRFDELFPYFGGGSIQRRTSSFDVIAFRVPYKWDEGVGFDNSTDFWFLGKRAVSYEGSNWYTSSGVTKWQYEGIYPNERLSREYEKYGNGEKSLVVARQHFEHGNEDMELDVTDFVNSLIDGTYDSMSEYTVAGGDVVRKNNGNCGLCIAFSPLTEVEDTDEVKYVGFFGNNTNTIFEPYLESYYDEHISDDRYRFRLGKKNKLYLYANINGCLENLDDIPTCEIDGTEYNVENPTKGVYCVELKLGRKDYEKDVILYDTWSNLKYDGEEIDDVEQEFVTKQSNVSFGIGENTDDRSRVSVTLSGIGANEEVNQNDKRIVHCTFNRKYSKGEYELLDSAKYRMYVKDGIREIDILPFQMLDTVGMENRFTVDCTELLPSEYHIDIEADRNGEHLAFKNVLTFSVVNVATKEKR